MAITWRDQPILDSVQLPGSNTKYWVADSEAREKIEALVGATHFMGVTTTPLEDGDTTNPITIDDKSYTAQTGDIVIYTPLTGSSLEFIWDGSKWQLLGGQAIEDLGALARKDSASGSYTPEGTINLIPELTDVVASVALGTLGVAADITDTETSGYRLANVGLDINLASSPISYFGSSQALKYINLASKDSRGNSYTAVVTDVSAVTTSVINYIELGDLPTISNQSAVTVAMGTGSSSTTLIFNLSDIGFNPGTQPSMVYTGVVEGISPISADVNFLTLSPNTVDIVYSASGSAPLYYSIHLSGGLDVDEGTALSGVTATFAGSTSTITVS